MKSYRFLPILTRVIASSAVLMILGSLTDISGFSSAGWVLLALLLVWTAGLAVIRVVRPLLWSVGRRLLVSYFLLAILPIPFLIGITYAVAYLGSGQLAARRVADELRILVHELEDIAGLAELSLVHLPASGPTPFRDRLPAPSIQSRFEQWIAPLPGAGIVHSTEAGHVGVGPWPAEDMLPSAGRIEDTNGIGMLEDGRHFLFVLRRIDAGNLLVYLPIEPHTADRLQQRARVGLAFPYAEMGPDRVIDSTHFEFGGEIQIQERVQSQSDDATGEPQTTDRTIVVEAPPGKPSDHELKASNIYWPRFLDMPYIRWAEVDWQGLGDPLDSVGSAEFTGRAFLYLTRTSMTQEIRELFDTFSDQESNNSLARGVQTSIQVMATVVVLVFFVASLLAAFLAFRIVRATHRLHQGMEAVEHGRFDHRIRFRGHDQLSALTQGFNEMAAHLETAVAERADRRAIDQQLQVARDLQQSLLPDDDVHLNGLELAVSFRPAAAIGGDFYHFIDHSEVENGEMENGESSQASSVVVADVSGHGLGTGIVMAAAQSLLAALSTEVLPAPEILGRLDRQLRRLTDRRTFITLAHCQFDPANQQVAVTCAGHLYPYRISGGGNHANPEQAGNKTSAVVVESVGRPGRPLGLSLGGELTVETATAPLASGDLWVLLSDGVVEAMDDQGELFGFERFEALLAHCAGRTATEARTLLLEALRRFTGDRAPEDDRTLIVIRIL